MACKTPLKTTRWYQEKGRNLSKGLKVTASFVADMQEENLL